MKALVSVFSFILNTAFFAAIALSLVKFLCENTGLGKKYRLLAGTAEIEDNSPGPTPYFKLILFAVGIRAALFAAATLLCIIFQSQNTFNMDFFIKMWHRWDSTGYVNLAKEGYYYTENGNNICLVFFPLYPIAMRLMFFITNSYYISGLAVSWLAYIGSVIYIYKLTAIDFKADTAFKTVVLISVFPFAFFFGSIHTESISLFTISACLYYIRRHNWAMVMIFGILASLSRLVGSLVIIPAVMEYIRVYKPFHALAQKQFGLFWRDIFTKFIFIPFIGTGALTYLWINYDISGDPFKFLAYQQTVWMHHAQSFIQTFYDLFAKAFGYLNSVNGCIWLPELIIVILTVALMIRLWRKIPAMYSAFLAGYIAVSYANSWLLSAGRYMSIALPLFIMLAVWTDKRPNRYLFMVITSSVFMAIYLAGYLFNKQVM